MWTEPHNFSGYSDWAAYCLKEGMWARHVIFSSQKGQDQPWGQSSSYSVGMKVAVRVGKLRGLAVNHSSLLLCRLRMLGAISSLPTVPS
jgi:hypothetical protein